MLPVIQTHGAQKEMKLAQGTNEFRGKRLDLWGDLGQRFGLGNCLLQTRTRLSTRGRDHLRFNRKYSA
jgi:hypothetical protein